jgi:CrcB protein
MTTGVGAGITWLQVLAVATGAVFGALLRWWAGLW